MPLDYQTLFNWASGALTMLALSIVSAAFAAVRNLFSDIAEFREEVAKDYVRKDDFNRVADRLFEKLDLIHDKLDRKMDK